MKKVLVVRLGAYGDVIQSTVILPLLKADGWHITFLVKKNQSSMLYNNPHIDEIILHDESVPLEGVTEYLAKMSENYDRMIDLNGSIEVGLLALEGREEFGYSKMLRHSIMNHNYYDRICEIAGYKVRGRNAEMYFSQLEMNIARAERRKNLGKFVVTWAISGSSHHKVYPHIEMVQRCFTEAHSDTVIYNVGDIYCTILEGRDSPQIKNKADKWSLRKAMAFAKQSDLIVSPETAMLCAAGCWETPTIAMLSHASVENLTKYFKNCTSLHGKADCHPCHKIHYDLTTCQLDNDAIVRGIPMCMSRLSPATVLNAMEDEYIKWRDQNGLLRRNGTRQILCG